MYNKFIVLDIKFRFTNDKWDLCWNTKFQKSMTSFVDKTCTVRQTSTRYYLLNWVCKYVQLNSKVMMNIIQYLHAQQLCTVFKVLYVQQFLCYLLPHAFFVCVYGRYDTINSHLTQIFMCATVNVEKVLLDFFYLCIGNYQFTKILLHVPMHLCIQNQ